MRTQRCQWCGAALQGNGPRCGQCGALRPREEPAVVPSVGPLPLPSSPAAAAPSVDRTPRLRALATAAALAALVFAALGGWYGLACAVSLAFGRPLHFVAEPGPQSHWRGLQPPWSNVGQECPPGSPEWYTVLLSAVVYGTVAVYFILWLRMIRAERDGQ